MRIIRVFQFCLVSVLCLVFLTSCGIKAEEFTEGADTRVEITGYKEYAGAYSDAFLKPGDKIAVIAPSALPSKKQIDAVMSGLREWGYVPVMGKYVTCETRTLQDCLDDLVSALTDPEIKAVFCVRGGHASSEVLDIMPLSLIVESGKLIIGYSDITAYHSAWTSSCVPSIHACMSGAFTDLEKECVEAEQKILKGQIPVYQCESNAYCQTGSAEGILIGGNLATLTTVLNTAYDCTQIEEPYILFLEEVEENYEHIHRFLTVLKHFGVLDGAAGIVFGEWTDIPGECGTYDGRSRGGAFASVADMIRREFLTDMDIPVAFGFPAGHADVNYPLLLGEKVRLNVGNDRYTLEW